jgi:surface antigen
MTLCSTHHFFMRIFMLKNIFALSMVAILSTACMQQGGDSFGANRGNGVGGTGISKSMIGGLAGAAGGAGLGAEIGSSLDRADMGYYNRTSQMALETGQPGQPLPWSNPQSGNSGSITPSNYYQAPNGQYCREYSQNINVGGRASQAFGRACRQPDGSWQIVE